MEQENTTTMDQEFTSNQSQSISTGNWVVTLLISSIPIVNIIMLFVWGFAGTTPESKANWAKAMLIWLAIIIGVYLIFGVVIGASIMNTMGY